MEIVRDLLMGRGLRITFDCSPEWRDVGQSGDAQPQMLVDDGSVAQRQNRFSRSAAKKALSAWHFQTRCGPSLRVLQTVRAGRVRAAGVP